MKKMQNHIYIKQHLKKGFSLLEMVLTMGLISLLLSTLPGLLNINIRNINQNEQIDYSDIHIMLSDINFDFALASTSTYDVNSITINRIDGCIIQYSYDQNTKTINKIPSGCPVGTTLRNTRVSNVISFITNEDTNGNILLEIKKDKSNQIFNYTFRNN